MARKSPRIQDVALAAGVSTATVSRTLSNPELVTESTRNAVQEAVRATGYRTNRAASNLRRRQAGAVLVLVPDLGNPFFSEILAGISAGFASVDRSVLIADRTQLRDGNRQLLNYFLDARIDGMISLDGAISAAELAELAAHHLSDRLVFACEWAAGSPSPSVRSDNAAGARAAIRHLYELGHRKIAHVTGPAENVLTNVRRDAALAERHRLGLPMRDDWVIRGDFSLQSGHHAAQLIFDMPERPTAVFCASDMVAFGLISGLSQHGLRVPEDISVVGFDDIEQAAYFVPALTTIHQDRRMIGQRAAEVLLSRLDATETGGTETGATEPPETGAACVEIIDVTLVARASSGPVPSPLPAPLPD